MELVVLWVEAAKVQHGFVINCVSLCLTAPQDQYGLLHNAHKQTKPAEFDRLHPPRRSHTTGNTEHKYVTFLSPNDITML